MDNLKKDGGGTNFLKIIAILQGFFHTGNECYTKLDNCYSAACKAELVTMNNS
jgi:hypothetical protein